MTDFITGGCLCGRLGCLFFFVFCLSLVLLNYYTIIKNISKCTSVKIQIYYWWVCISMTFICSLITFKCLYIRYCFRLWRWSIKVVYHCALLRNIGQHINTGNWRGIYVEKTAGVAWRWCNSSILSNEERLPLLRVLNPINTNSLNIITRDTVLELV